MPILAAARAEQAKDGVVLSWGSEVGQRYQLQYKSDWYATDWIDLGNVIVATDITATVSDVVGSDQVRFYRLVLLP